MMAGPRRIGKYEICEEVGRGRFAVVYKARDTELDRIVALKVLHLYWAADPGFATRFRREARAVARLRHPHIVTVYDAGEADGQLYIAMEYLPGRTLQKLLEAKQALPLEQALPILDQIARALDYAHGQGVVHRDVKPSNVMVEETGPGVHVTLMDFGLVKPMGGSSALTSEGALVGSLEYMAPEQADPERAGEIGPATDRYALGIVAYQMLTGRVPFPGNTLATLNAHRTLPPPDPQTIRKGMSPGVAAALPKMLAKAPRDRFASAGAFVAHLQGRPVTGRPCARWPWVLAAVLALICIGLLLGTFVLGRTTGQGPAGTLFWTETPTVTSTPAPTPTATPTPTPTPTPSPTVTKTPTPPPTATPLPTPELVGPDDGTAYYPRQTATLAWTWPLTLDVDRRFVVTVENESGTHVLTSTVKPGEETAYTFRPQEAGLSPGTYHWTVRVEWNNEGVWEVIALAGPERTFRVLSPPAATPTPTPIPIPPTDTPQPGGGGGQPEPTDRTPPQP